MEKLIKSSLSTLLLLVLNFVSAEDKFFGEGGELLLRSPFSGEITNILWMHNNINPVAEWEKGAVDPRYYDTFKGRTTLNITTGSLKIKNMRPADSGEYSVEINNKVQPERYNAKLIEAVPKPFVLVRPLVCSAASEKCTLICEGNTEKAEPVTYSWKMGGGEWMDGEKDRSITNNETIKSVEMFSCWMKNPISEEESDPKPNPFFKEEPPSNTGTVVGVIVGLLLFVVVVVVVVVGVWKRQYIMKRFFSQINCKRKRGRDETI